MKATPDIQPSEILCLEHGSSYLYAEVIQIVPVRQLYWVRPLILKVLNLDSSDQERQFEFNEETLYDLRQGADLLLPASLFRTTLDVEVIPLLNQLGDLKLQVDGDRFARQRVQELIWQIWQAHPDAFHEQ